MTVAPPLPAASSAPTADEVVPVAPGRRGRTDEASLRLYGLVRDIRVEAQHLSRLLEPARQAVKATGAQTQATALAAALRDVHRVFRTSRPEVADRLAAVHALLADHPALYNDVGDAIAELENQWLEMEHALTWSDAPDVAGMVPRLATFDDRLPKLEWQAAIVTVPIRVIQHLGTKRIGGRVNFHEAFKDELESRDLRVELLRYLREHAASLDCVVDVPNGMLYRVAPGVGRRAWSWILVVGLATVGGYGFVVLLTQGLPALGLPSGTVSGLRPDRLTELLGAWWGLVLGAVAHLVVDAIKQEQVADSGAFTALEDWFVWGHVREYALVVTVVSLGAILVGLAVLFPDPGSIAFLTALGAGYSSDSVLGLFVTRFQTAASVASDVVTEKLKVTPTA